MNYQTVQAISAPTGCTTPWDLNFTVFPHPVEFGAMYSDDHQGNTAVVNVLNAQLDGPTHHDKYLSLLGFAERWRICYMGITLYQDAPAVSDQGTLVACQTAVAADTCVSATTIVGTWAGPPTQYSAHVPIRTYGPTDAAAYTTSQTMPNAYFGRSKEGLYMPLKLTRTCQNWRSAADSWMTSASTTVDAEDGSIELSNTAALAGGVYPFVDLPAFYADPITGVHGGQHTSDFLNDVWGFVSATNISPSTSFSVYFRVGIEIQVQPGSAMSMYQRISPKYDKKALTSYYAVSRELKDAYPADFNDAGKIIKEIFKVVSSAGPLLGMIPGVGPILAGIASGAGALGSLVPDQEEAVLQRASSGVPAGRQQGSAGDVETLRAVSRLYNATPNVITRAVSFGGSGPSAPTVSKRKKKKKVVRMPTFPVRMRR